MIFLACLDMDGRPHLVNMALVLHIQAHLYQGTERAIIWFAAGGWDDGRESLYVQETVEVLARRLGERVVCVGLEQVAT